MSSRSPKIQAVATGLLILLTGPFLRAFDGPASYTIDLPFQTDQATPAWLGHPVTPATTFATLDLPIIPPDANASLLVTVYFSEKDGGFLRVNWNGGQGSAVLSNNFYEGIGMSNQRSLLVSAQTLQGAGMLDFQCGSPALGIGKIKLEWLENQTALVSPQIQDLLVTPENGMTQPAQNLNGQPKPAESPAWRNEIVDIPVTDIPQRIEEGVEFSVDLDEAPGAARLSMREAGLPWGKHLVLWINQQRAGVIMPAVPSLLDEGFSLDAGSAGRYVGWRDGSLYVPVSVFKTGANAVQFSVEDDSPSPGGASAGADASGTIDPLAVKDVVFQLGYPAAPATPPVPAPSPDQTETGPVTTAAPSSAPAPLATSHLEPRPIDSSATTP
jgi:hypothetical protein